MVLKPYARPSYNHGLFRRTMYNKTMGFIGGLAHGFKTMYGGDVVIFVPKNIKNNKTYYMSAINNIKY